MDLLRVEFEEGCLVRTRRAVLACACDQGVPDERLEDFLAAVNECVARRNRSCHAWFPDQSEPPA